MYSKYDGICMQACCDVALAQGIRLRVHTRTHTHHSLYVSHNLHPDGTEQEEFEAVAPHLGFQHTHFNTVPPLSLFSSSVGVVVNERLRAFRWPKPPPPPVPLLPSAPPRPAMPPQIKR